MTKQKSLGRYIFPQFLAKISYFKYPDFEHKPID